MFSFLAIYYCTHLDNEQPDLFQDFCKTFLPQHPVERITGEHVGKERIVLVLMLPSVYRLHPIDYFSERFAKMVDKYGLRGTMHALIYFYFYPRRIRIWW